MKTYDYFPGISWETEDGIFRTRVTRSGDGFRSYARNVLKFPGKCVSSLEDRDFSVNGEVPDPKRRLKEGDILTVNLNEPRKETVVPRDIPFRVIYEDQHILAVDKPRGIPTHPSFGHFEDTLANGVMAYSEKKGENYPFRPVNRLDRDTSGIVLVAKHRLSCARLFQQMKNGDTEKYYLGFTGKPLPHPRGILDFPIGRKEGSVLLRCVREDGEIAKTAYLSLGKGQKGAYPALFRLYTGRTHQIRVHLAHIGCPLLGDPFYGEENELGGHLLHALTLRFYHPMTGERMDLYCPPPPLMEERLPGEISLPETLTDWEKSGII